MELLGIPELTVALSPPPATPHLTGSSPPRSMRRLLPSPTVTATHRLGSNHYPIATVYLVLRCSLLQAVGDAPRRHNINTKVEK
ncbi:hypothetical protein J6590_050476 [Homalodisca vitripennis]|nr:hypothetical protein J6590_050476 [Homalodisca vitripennis]